MSPGMVIVEPVRRTTKPAHQKHELLPFCVLFLGAVGLMSVKN